jgi:hypothetical protein
MDPGTPEYPEIEDDEEDDSAALANCNRVLASINSSDVMRDVADLITDDDLASPLIEQLNVWLDQPLTAIDPGHLAVAPHTAESVGRHVLGLMAAVLERKVKQAAATLGPVPF